MLPEHWLKGVNFQLIPVIIPSNRKINKSVWLIFCYKPNAATKWFFPSLPLFLFIYLFDTKLSKQKQIPKQLRSTRIGWVDEWDCSKHRYIYFFSVCLLFCLERSLRFHQQLPCPNCVFSSSGFPGPSWVLYMKSSWSFIKWEMPHIFPGEGRLDSSCSGLKVRVPRTALWGFYPPAAMAVGAFSILRVQEEGSLG